MKTLVLVLGYILVDVCSWHLSLPLYLGVQVGVVTVYISATMGE
jgi:hypothetical protein